MARYLAVGTVQTEGRSIPRPAPDLPPPIPDGSRLVAVVNNGEWQSALDVTFPAVYEKVHRRHQEGIWTAMDLYLIDARRADEIEDGRRVLMNGQPVKDPGRV